MSAAARRNHRSTSSSSSSPTGTIDADSLLASTLLRIRTDAAHIAPAPAAAEATRISPIIPFAPRSNNNILTTQAATTPTSGRGGGPQQNNMQFPTPNAVAAANLNSASSRMSRASMAPTTMAGMFGIHNNSHHHTYGDHLTTTLEQIHTLQALAANQAVSLAAVAAAAASNSPLVRHRNAANFAAAAPSPHCPNPLGQFDHLQASSHAAAASSPTTSSFSSPPQGQQMVLLPPEPLAARTPSVRQQLAAEVALHMSENNINNSSNNNNTEPASASAIAVRKEQVEAALHSKPQRGRKREELSEMERMELTRTRNREHARSTRIRKKARYQELLDCEEQLESVQKQQDVQQKRRLAVLDFLALRCSMLLLAGAPTSPTDAPPLPSSTAASTKSLSDLVEDPDQFCFRFNEFHPSSSSNKDDCDRPAAAAALSSNSVQHMKNFDNQLISRVVGIFGKAVLPFVRYSIKGSLGGGGGGECESSSLIALDLGHGGFAHVEISLVPRPAENNKEEKILLMTGVVQFDFSESDKKSDKLRSVVWSTMRDYLNDLSDGLVSHPSVVSLDPAMMLIQESASSTTISSGSSEATAKEQTSQERQPEEGGGPGMNI